MQPMNINITSSKDNTETEDYSEFEKYIIKNNIQLTKENKELRDKISTLEKHNNEQESEIDKFDERIRYMRGLLHNLYILKELNLLVRNNWESYVKKYSKIFNLYHSIDKYFKKIISIYILNLFIILLIDIIFNNKFIIISKMIIYNFILMILFKKFIINDNLYKIYWYNKNIQIKYNDEYYKLKKDLYNLETETKDKVKEITELEKACVGVSVMIDNI
jgi:FtsZ-binding cell division protein ZapB